MSMHCCLSSSRSVFTHPAFTVGMHCLAATSRLFIISE